jgi:hypothetical protein
VRAATSFWRRVIWSAWRRTASFTAVDVSDWAGNNEAVASKMLTQRGIVTAFIMGRFFLCTGLKARR